MPSKAHEELTQENFHIWFVDDHISNEEVRTPILNCLQSFLRKIDGTTDHHWAVTPASSYPGSLLPDCVEWIAETAFRHAFQLSTDYGVIRSIRLKVAGIDEWDGPISFFQQIADTRLSWPHLVMTDLYKGTPCTPDINAGLYKLPGYQLAEKCRLWNIPVILFSSDTATIESRTSAFMGKDNWYHFRREDGGAKGPMLDALVQEIWPRLRKAVWNDEFDFSVRGEYSEENNSYTVEFRKAGQVVSCANNVGPVPYCYLYLWAHASKLAMLRRWSAAELTHFWESSACIPVSADGEKQLTNTRRPLFEPAFWNKHKKLIFHRTGWSAGNCRVKSILNANIEFLEPPRHAALPIFWQNQYVLHNLSSVLPAILPEDGTRWLRNVLATF